MAEEVPTAPTLSMAKSGFQEDWLQNYIYGNPSCLNLGDLVSVERERPQPSGGRLDLLLKNDNLDSPSYYEVEVMLGDTDASHIVRTLEYWDNERRRLPQATHYAVLVAESITRRFFGVIQLLSQTLPIIAIQASLIEIKGQRALHFTTVLDAYEPEETDIGPVEPTTEDDWRKKAPWTLETAGTLLDVVKPTYGQVSLGYAKYFMALRVNHNNYFWLEKRSASKSQLGFRIDADNAEKVTTLLDQSAIPLCHKDQADIPYGG